MKNNILTERAKIIDLSLFLMVVVSPLMVLQLFDKEVFLWFQIIFVVIFAIRFQKIKIIKYPVIILLFLEPFISGIIALFSAMPLMYKKTAINLAIMSMPLYFSICCIAKMISKGYHAVEIIVNAIKCVILIEIVWFIVQLACYRLAGIDINKAVFVGTLHMVSNASFIRSWVWYPSGLSWHSAVLAPLFVMGILFFDSMIIRCVILLEAFLCGNSTTLLGCLFCIVLLVVNALYTKKSKIRKKHFSVFLTIVAIFFLVLLTTNLGEKLSSVLANLWTRLFGAEKDASTEAHLGYYSDYFKIVKMSSIFQILFGYGIGCSGYTISSMYGRYLDGGTWAIECDYVNIIVSRGVIGFAIYYLFLLRIMIKGYRIDHRYGIFVLTLLFQGFGYNIQFDYLLLVELVMYILISKRINFFAYVDKLNGRRKSTPCLLE